MVSKSVKGVRHTTDGITSYQFMIVLNLLKYGSVHKPAGIFLSDPPAARLYGGDAEGALCVVVGSGIPPASRGCCRGAPRRDLLLLLLELRRNEGQPTSADGPDIYEQW